jgi:hypothetical protein
MDYEDELEELKLELEYVREEAKEQENKEKKMISQL